jgi:hypothetical protein
LVFFTQQEEGRASHFADGNFTLVVTVAGLEAYVENIFMAIAVQHASHQGFAAP